MIDTTLTVARALIVVGAVFVALGLAGIVWRVFRRKRARSSSGTAS